MHRARFLIELKFINIYIYNIFIDDTKANFNFLPICNRQIVCGSYFGVYEAPVGYTALRT